MNADNATAMNNGRHEGKRRNRRAPTGPGPTNVLPAAYVAMPFRCQEKSESALIEQVTTDVCLYIFPGKGKEGREQ